MAFNSAYSPGRADHFATQRNIYIRNLLTQFTGVQQCELLLAFNVTLCILIMR